MVLIPFVGLVAGKAFVGALSALSQLGDSRTSEFSSFATVQLPKGITEHASNTAANLATPEGLGILCRKVHELSITAKPVRHAPNGRSDATASTLAKIA